MIRETFNLKNVPGIRGGKIVAVGFNSIDDAIELIETERAITLAGANGSITIWFGDCGSWHGEFHRYKVVEGRTVFSCVEEIRPWLNVWFPELGEIPRD